MPTKNSAANTILLLLTLALSIALVFTSGIVTIKPTPTPGAPQDPATYAPKATTVVCPATATPQRSMNREFPNAAGALDDLETAWGLMDSAQRRTAHVVTAKPGAFDNELVTSVNETLAAQKWTEQAMTELQFWIDAGYFTCPSDYQIDVIRQEVQLSTSNLQVVQDLLDGCLTDRCAAIQQWVNEAEYHQAKAEALMLGKPEPTTQP